MPTDLPSDPPARDASVGTVSARLPEWRVETHEQLRSTQDAMREQLEAGPCVHGLVIRALEQSSGRGQRARDWHSGRGGSWQTAAVYDPDGHLARSPVTLAIAVGLCAAFLQAGVTLSVKWPNDLLVGNLKVAGILCENVQGHLLAGVGVNVHNGVPDGAATLPLLQSGRALQLEQVNEIVLEGVRGGLSLAYADAAGLPAAFAAIDALAGQKVEVLQGQRVLRGKALGIDTAGSLQLQLDIVSAAAHAAGQGEIISVRSGRVRQTAL